MSIALRHACVWLQHGHGLIGSIGSHGVTRAPAENDFASSYPPKTVIAGVPTACASSTAKPGAENTSAARSKSPVSTSKSSSPA